MTTNDNKSSSRFSYFHILMSPIIASCLFVYKIIFEQDYISAAFIVAIMIVIDYLAKNRGKLKEFEIM